LITMLPLLPLLAPESLAIWGVVATYLGVVMAASAACLTLQSQSNRTRGRRTMAIVYLIASKFGRA